MDIQKHRFRLNVTSVEPNIYGKKITRESLGHRLSDEDLEQFKFGEVIDVVDNYEVVELYTDKKYIVIDEGDARALAIHFGLIKEKDISCPLYVDYEKSCEALKKRKEELKPKSAFPTIDQALKKVEG